MKRLLTLLPAVSAVVSAAIAQTPATLSMPAGGLDYKCIYCSHEEKNARRLDVTAIADDRIYHLATVDGALGTRFHLMHVYPVRSDLKLFADFKRFRNENAARLTDPSGIMSESRIREFNHQEAVRQRETLGHIAPYGFLSDVAIGCDDGMSMAFYFTNVDRRTVASLILELDYRSVAGTGERATFEVSGPIARYEEAEFSIDSSRYRCVAEITDIRLRISYTDGSTQTLSGSDVPIDSSH